jgi:hypothetical protein
VLGLRHVVDVAHRGADVAVAHVALDRGQVPHLDGERAERVAQVVEGDRLGLVALVPEARDTQGGVEAAAQLRCYSRTTLRAGLGSCLSPLLWFWAATRLNAMQQSDRLRCRQLLDQVLTGARRNRFPSVLGACAPLLGG